MTSVYTGAGTADAVKKTQIQVAHGFTIGQCIYYDNASPGQWDLAQANNEATLKMGVVSDVLNADNFVITNYGKMPWALHGFNPDDTHWLSDTISGGTRNDSPTAAGTLSQVAFDVIDDNTIFILDQAVVDNSLSSLSKHQWIDADALLSPGVGYTIDTRTQNIQLNLPDPLTLLPGNFIKFDWSFTDAPGINTITVNGNGALIAGKASSVMDYSKFLHNIELTFDGTKWFVYYLENRTLELTPDFYDFNNDVWGTIQGTFFIEGIDGLLLTNTPFNPVDGELYDISGSANSSKIYTSRIDVIARGTGSPPSLMMPRYFIRDGETWEIALNNEWNEICGPSIEALTFDVAQSGHGFIDGQFVYNETTGSPPTSMWKLADSSDIESIAHGMVIQAGLHFFSVVVNGVVNLPVHGFNFGDYYYLSDTIPGGISSNFPTNSTSVTQPVLKVIDVDRVLVMVQAPTSDTTILAESVIKLPQSSSRNDITPAAIDNVIPLRIIQDALHNVNAFEIHSSQGQVIEITADGTTIYRDDGSAGSPPGLGTLRVSISSGNSTIAASSGIDIFDHNANERFVADGEGIISLSDATGERVNIDPTTFSLTITDTNDRDRIILTGSNHTIKLRDSTDIERVSITENEIRLNAPITANARTIITADATNNQATFGTSDGTQHTRFRVTHNDPRPNFESTLSTSIWSNSNLERFIQTFSRARKYPAGDKILNESKQFAGDTAIWLALVNIPAGVWNWNDIEGGSSGNNYWRLITGGGGGTVELYSATEIYKDNSYIFQWDTRRGTTWLGLWLNSSGSAIGPEAWDQSKWTLISGQYYKTFGSEFTNTGVITGGKFTLGSGGGSPAIGSGGSPDIGSGGSPDITIEVTIASGQGVIVDRSHTGAITTEFIEWNETVLDFPNIVIDQNYYIWVNDTGNVISDTSQPATPTFRSQIYLGSVHRDILEGNEVGVLNDWPTVAQTASDIANDINRLFFSTSIIGGGEITFNGINRQIDAAAARVYSPGVNFHANSAVANEITTVAQTAITFSMIDSTGTVVEKYVQDVNVTHWDNSGVQTLITSGSAVTHRLFVNLSTNLFILLQSQAEHLTLQTAIDQINVDDLNLIVPDTLKTGSIFLGWISVIKGAVDLSGSAQAIFRSAGGKSISGGGSIVEELGGLSDVTLANRRSFQQFTYNGTLWTNQDPNIVCQWIEQPAHGFIPNQQVFYGETGSPLTFGWYLADASNESSLKHGHIAQVDPPDWFLLVYSGIVTSIGHGYTIGEKYWLTDDGSGNPTINALNAISSWKQLIFEVIDNNTLKILDYIPEKNAAVVYSEFISRDITQVGHGFFPGQFITQDNTGVWVLAQANNINTLATSYVLNVSGDDFIIIVIGDIEIHGHGFPIKSLRYLSDTIPGGNVDEANAPQLPGTFQQMIMEVLDVNTVRIVNRMAYSN